MRNQQRAFLAASGVAACGRGTKISIHRCAQRLLELVRRMISRAPRNSLHANILSPRTPQILARPKNIQHRQMSASVYCRGVGPRMGRQGRSQRLSLICAKELAMAGVYGEIDSKAGYDRVLLEASEIVRPYLGRLARLSCAAAHPQGARGDAEMGLRTAASPVRGNGAALTSAWLRPGNSMERRANWVNSRGNFSR